MLTLASLEADVQASIGDLQLSTTTSSLANQHLARGWAMRCEGSHKRCVRILLRGSIRPSRLLKIIHVSGNIVLRIVETRNLPLDEEYITLSHCWGTAKFLTLRMENRHKLEEGLLFSDLPKTFQNAVMITG